MVYNDLKKYVSMLLLFYITEAKGIDFFEIYNDEGVSKGYLLGTEHSPVYHALPAFVHDYIKESNKAFVEYDYDNITVLVSQVNNLKTKDDLVNGKVLLSINDPRKNWWDRIDEENKNFVSNCLQEYLKNIVEKFEVSFKDFNPNLIDYLMSKVCVEQYTPKVLDNCIVNDFKQKGKEVISLDKRSNELKNYQDHKYYLNNSDDISVLTDRLKRIREVDLSKIEREEKRIKSIKFGPSLNDICSSFKPRYDNRNQNSFARNLVWAKSLEVILPSLNDKFFIAIGASHLYSFQDVPNAIGMIDLLKNMGFDVKRITDDNKREDVKTTEYLFSRDIEQENGWKEITLDPSDKAITEIKNNLKNDWNIGDFFNRLNESLYSLSYDL